MNIGIGLGIAIFVTTILAALSAIAMPMLFQRLFRSSKSLPRKRGD
ncbi:hypothetical protein [Metallibacterium scheffleri]|nr:hypothetical protein [Metallibacterium scheffleri]